LYLIQFLPGKLTFYGRVLKSVACEALLRKTSEDKITIFSDPSEKKENK
jgi:hypothetical protein